MAHLHTQLQCHQSFDLPIKACIKDTIIIIEQYDMTMVHYHKWKEEATIVDPAANVSPQTIIEYFLLMRSDKSKIEEGNAYKKKKKLVAHND